MADFPIEPSDSINMTPLNYLSINDEVEEMRMYLDSLFQQMEVSQQRILLSSVRKEPKMLPSKKSDVRIEISEKENEILVIMDIIEGTVKSDISIDLVNSQLLEISSKNAKVKKEERFGSSKTEWKMGSLTQIIPIPTPVTEEGSTALYRNGRLEIHLRKAVVKEKMKIIIE